MEAQAQQASLQQVRAQQVQPRAAQVLRLQPAQAVEASVQAAVEEAQAQTPMQMAAVVQ